MKTILCQFIYQKQKNSGKMKPVDCIQILTSFRYVQKFMASIKISLFLKLCQKMFKLFFSSTIERKEVNNFIFSIKILILGYFNLR